MKLDTKKYLAGGLLFSAVVNPASLAALEASAALSSSSSSSKSPELLSKESLNTLIKTGLTNEFDQFSEVLAALEKEVDATGEIDRDQLATVRAMANRILQNKDYLDKAIENAKTHEALDEVAIDQDGYIYARDKKGKVQKVAFNKYNAKEYIPLSVSELIEFRRNNPSAINNSAMISDINNSMGLEKINTFIQDILAKVGNAETKSEAYENLGTLLTKDKKKMTQQDFDALKAVAAASDQIGFDTIFKTSQLTKNKNVLLACLYIMSILPKNMKLQLKARYIVNGGSEKNSNEYAAQLIQMAAFADNEVVNDFSMDYLQDINNAAGTSAGTEKLPKTRNITALEEIVMGTLNKVKVEFRDRRDPNSSLVLHGNGKGYIPDPKGGIMPKTVATIIMEKSLGPLVDQNQLYMGNQKISLATMNSIVYNGQGIVNVWAPVNANGDLDFSAFVQFQQLEEEFDRHPEYTAEDKNSTLREMGINGYYDESGTFHGGNNMAKFLVFTGITSDEVLDPDKTKLVDVIPDSQKKDEMTQIDSIYNNVNKAYGDGKKIFEFKKGIFKTSLLTAPVFMKIARTAYDDVTTMTGNGAMVTTPDYASSIARDNMSYQANEEPKLEAPSTAYIFAK